MKLERLIRACTLPLMLALALGMTACDRASKVRKLAEDARPLLKPELVSLRSDHFVPDTHQLVLLIGENHASVKTQQQLASLVSGLLDAHSLDTVLLEGTNGAVDSSDLKTRLASELGPDSTVTDVYWRQQLDSGMLAGYEFVALTRPSLDIFGVEDMGAKARNASALEERGLRDAGGIFLRGADLLDKALAAMLAAKTGVDLGPVGAEVTAARQTAVAYAEAVEKMVPELAPYWKAREALQLQQEPFAAALQRLQSATPSFADRDEWAAQANALATEGKTLAARMLGQGALLSDGSGTEAAAQQAQEKLQRIKQDHEALHTKIAEFDQVHAADISALTAWQAATKELQEAGDAAKTGADRREAAEAEASNAYFIAANSLRILATGSATPIPALHAFFRDEQQKAEQNGRGHSELLAERDAAMARNTVDYLRTHESKRVVVLVVGYAHLPGIERELAAQKVSYLSGELAASTAPIEAWEAQAWNQRHRAGRANFSGKPGLKEIPQLQSEGWKSEQIEKLKLFRKFEAQGAGSQPSIEGLAWGGRVFEGVGGEDRALRVGKFPFDKNAAFGAHVLDRGPVPGGKGEFYELVDRKLAGEQAKDLSNAEDQFVFFYKTKTGSDAGAAPGYRFRTSGAEWSLEQFMAKMRADAGAPKRVVMFGESDEVMDGDVAMSPLWRRLQSDGGGRGGPPPNEPRRFGFGEPEEPRRGNGNGGGAGGGNGNGPPPEPPSGGQGAGRFGYWRDLLPSLLPDATARRKPQLLRTINAERAQTNLAALDKQRPDYIGDVHFMTEVDMADLPAKLMFTPDRGDHTQMVVLMGHNVAELRAAIRSAGEAKLLKGKQIALVMCGDSFGETASLRESLLQDGALMVWANDRQVTEQAGQRLLEYAKAAAAEMPAAERKTIDELMARAVRNWREQSPRDPDLTSFSQAATYVLLDRKAPPARNRIEVARGASDQQALAVPA